MGDGGSSRDGNGSGASLFGGIAVVFFPSCPSWEGAGTGVDIMLKLWLGIDHAVCAKGGEFSLR